MSLRTLRGILVLSFLFAALPLQAQQAERTRNPHGKLELACQNCHVSSSWKPARAVPDFDHNTQTRYPLLGQHRKAACTTCHVDPVFRETSASCSSCHADIHRRQFGANCEGCHTVQGWQIQVEAIRQHANRFPLVGAHAAATCESCHHGAASGAFTGLSTACVSCHAPDYAAARTVDHRAAGFSTSCEGCHSMSQWKNPRLEGGFDHTANTRFPLLGSHVQATCAQCHPGNRFSGTPQDCASCHGPQYDRTTNPDHAAARFSRDCSTCHGATTWRGAVFDHSRTRFPLMGAHASATCSGCHTQGRFAGISTTCASCHLPDYAATTKPNHTAAKFSQDCQSCHLSTVKWQGASFDHSRTRFPLTGAHVPVQCAGCHAGDRYTGTPTACYSCHAPAFAAAVNPPHASPGFSQDCTLCHSTTSTWRGAAFDHSRTRFPLMGAHASATCASCHAGGRFTGTPTACYSCHAPAFAAAANPNHAAAGFPQDCTLCHSTSGWRPSSFDHSRTRFPLMGAHSSATCSSCHAQNRFAGTPTACVSCHLADFTATTKPSHVAAAFSQDCQSCHTSVVRWQGATFDHSRTRFVLTGAHIGAQCADCHVNNRFSGTSAACYSCHAPAFNTALNPNHVAAGFPQDCVLCHGTSAWRPASFDHSLTRFPLMGAHVSATCNGCHAGGRFAGTPTTCVSCHLAGYTATTNPNHAAAGFPQDCQLCHTTTRWQGATFDHSRTRFPLSGAHTTAQCAGCHVGNRFSGTPTTCYSCHATEFRAVTNPNHAAAGFPTTCESCHTTSAWAGARFTHRFPIYSGAHSGKWSTCNDCHTNTSNYAVFACTNCHAHDQTSMDKKHKGRTGYVYDSLSCYGCHPNGRH